MIAHTFAQGFLVEVCSMCARYAFFLFPLCAQTLLTRNELIRIPYTVSALHDVPLVTGLALSLFCPSVAQIANRSTNVFIVEKPPFRALNALIVLPLLAAPIVGVEKINQDAFAINNFPALVAFLADAFGAVEDFALGFELGADVVFVEIEPV